MKFNINWDYFVRDYRDFFLFLSRKSVYVDLMCGPYKTQLNATTLSELEADERRRKKVIILIKIVSDYP